MTKFVEIGFFNKLSDFGPLADEDTAGTPNGPLEVQISSSYKIELRDLVATMVEKMVMGDSGRWGDNVPYLSDYAKKDDVYSKQDTYSASQIDDKFDRSLKGLASEVWVENSNIVCGSARDTMLPQSNIAIDFSGNIKPLKGDIRLFLTKAEGGESNGSYLGTDGCMVIKITSRGDISYFPMVLPAIFNEFHQVGDSEPEYIFHDPYGFLVEDSDVRRGGSFLFNPHMNFQFLHGISPNVTTLYTGSHELSFITIGLTTDVDSGKGGPIDTSIILPIATSSAANLRYPAPLTILFSGEQDGIKYLKAVVVYWVHTVKKEASNPAGSYKITISGNFSKVFDLI